MCGQIDDLEQISALRQYVEETAVVLMFLSRGCVASLRSRQPSPWPPVLPSACRARAHAPCRPGCSYFASKNVLVEVEASVNEQKPLVLSNFSSVQEGGVEL